jgi:hypothetical protein
MKLDFKWFSLIEVVIATSIITITVFWVYKLIWENTKIITNSSNYLQVNSLFPLTEECFEEKWFSTFTNLTTWDKYYLYLWSNLDKCNNNPSWTIIDNVEYNIYWLIQDKDTDYINWTIFINSDETKTFTWTYKQIKK